MLIMEEAIDNQAELIKRMTEEGFEVTQATISRDLRDLHIIKMPNEAGKYVYTVMRN